MEAPKRINADEALEDFVLELERFALSMLFQPGVDLRESIKSATYALTGQKVKTT